MMHEIKFSIVFPLLPAQKWNVSSRGCAAVLETVSCTIFSTVNNEEIKTFYRI
jgi:hypothetical protein